MVLVEHDPTVRFAPSFLWVMSGARRRDQIVVDISRQRRRGVEVVIDEVTAIDPAGAARTHAHELAYDWLIVAPGTELAPDALPGFAGKPLLPRRTKRRRPSCLQGLDATTRTAPEPADTPTHRKGTVAG